MSLPLAASPAIAASVGNVRTVAPASARDAAAWDIATDAGARLRIDLLRADTLRVQAGRDGTFAPAGDKAAPIVLPQPAGKVAATLEEDANEFRIRTEALVLHIQRNPLRLSLERIDAGKEIPLWHELQPLDLAKEQTVQVLSSAADERFYGGGQQNGRFEFKGRELPISYSGG